jgi:hypothetical protein
MRPSKPAGDLRLRDASAAELEGFNHLPRLARVGHETLVFAALVADRGAAREDARLDRTTSGSFPIGAVALPLLASDRGLDREGELLVARAVSSPSAAQTSRAPARSSASHTSAVARPFSRLRRSCHATMMPAASPRSQASTASPRARSRQDFDPETFCSMISAASSTPFERAQA